MHLRKLLIISASALSLALLPARANAQSWFFTPFVGGNFGGNASFNSSAGDFEDSVEKRVDFGATIGWNPSVVGFEVDFGWSPNFFENTIGPGNFEFGDSNVTTLMGNVIVGAPIGGTHGWGVRPYGTIGVGWLRSQYSVGPANTLAGSVLVHNNDIGMNAGVGVMGFANNHVGLRGDVRYFRNFDDNSVIHDINFGAMHFWRASFGIMLR